MRLTRQIIAGITLVLITLYFINLSGFLPQGLKIDFLIQIQVLPAILAGFTWAIIGLAIATLISGRLYCSVLCPLGIFQDLVIRLSHKRKAWRKKRSLYRQPHHFLRYSILALAIITLLLGSSAVVLWLDPYSIFGRAASMVLSPIVTVINNGLASIASLFDSYRFSHQDIHWAGFSAITSTLATLGILLYINVKHQRLWCNTLCPVGTLLGLISRFSWLKIKVDQNKCISCNACARTCKSNCIDEKNNFKIDYSRCVTCFNCMDSCKTNAISYAPTKLKNNGH